jgi:GMP synthase-like glutamine amidotransferase
MLAGDAVSLARAFPNQAFCYGPADFGVQFHPEITLAMIRSVSQALCDLRITSKGMSGRAPGLDLSIP